MQNSVRRSLRLALPLLCLSSASFLRAQDAGLALSTSVGYNTQRASLQLTPEQAAEAARLGREATQATQAGKYGDALNFYAQGMAVMHNVAWTPDVEFASSLRGKVDHAMVDQSGTAKVAVSLAPLYAAARAGEAKLNAAIFLSAPGKDAMNIAPNEPVDPARPFTESVSLPAGTPGNYTLEVRLSEADGSSPEGLRTAFVKSIPVHIESLSADAQRLRDALAKIGRRDNPSLATAEYTLNLCPRQGSRQRPLRRLLL